MSSVAVVAFAGDMGDLRSMTVRGRETRSQRGAQQRDVFTTHNGRVSLTPP
jgi:hypothetical protein